MSYYKPIPKISGNILKRFESKIFYGSPDGCHYWVGFVDNMGYGCVQVHGIRYKSSRVSYTVYKEEIPFGLNVCHSCDNILCVNPDHLFLGTQKDNIQDCINKGRKNPATGSRVGMSKLTESDIIKIRQLIIDGESVTQIAKIMDVTYNTIGDIKKNKAWKHVK